jgi:hypothetical protein
MTMTMTSRKDPPMSDRAYAQVVIYDCPPDQRAAARAAIYDAFEAETLNEEPQIDNAPGSDRYDAARWTPAEELVLGDRYGEEECSLDMNDTIAGAIIAAAPGATFAAWVDPKYEYPGALTMYAPDLGRFDADCDADGNPTVTGYQVRQILKANADAIAAVAAIRTALGSAWETRIDELRAVIDPPAAP